MRLSPNSAILLVMLLTSASCGQITTDSTETLASPVGLRSAFQRASSRDNAKKPSTVDELANEAYELLKSESVANSLSEQIQHALQLVELTNRLSANPRSQQRDSLRKLRKSLLKRLRTIEKRTLAQQRSQKRRPEQIEIKQEVLAQLNQAVNAVNPRNAIQPNNAAQDYGPLLVELIQRTISPSSWVVNGGASTIQYWRPGMALVVRAPTGVHSELAPILGQLRKQ